VAHGEDPETTRAQHPRDLPHHCSRVRDERHCAERRTGQVETAVGEGQSTGIGLHQWNGNSGFVRRLHRVPQHSSRQVQADDPRALGGQPAGARCRPATDLEHSAARQLAEQAGG
jgi:hypothetical protein